MKNILVSLGFILFFSSISFASETNEPIYLAIEDVKPEFIEELNSDLNEILNDSQKKNEEIFKEKTNFDLNSELNQNSISPLEAEIEYDILFEKTPVLSEYTSIEFESGPIETFKPFFAYQGQFMFDFNTQYSTKYLNPTSEIGFNGKFRNKPINYTFILNFLPEGDYNFFKTMFKDDFITLNYIPNNEIVIGNFRTPIGVEGGTSGYTLPFIARSQISRNFGSVRALGTKVIGNYRLAEYNVGVTSSDRYWSKFFPGAEFNGWVNFKPLGKTDGRYGVLKIGGGLNAGHRDLDYTVVGAYLSYKFRKFAMEAEYAVSNGSNGLAGLTSNKAQGLYTTLSYNLTKNLQILTRYDYFDADRNSSGKNSSEYTAGLNYYIKGSALKFMLNYTYCHSDYENSSNRIMLGTQILL